MVQMVHWLYQEAMMYYLKYQYNSNTIINNEQILQIALNWNKIKM